MRFLFASNFFENPDSGAAGTIAITARELEKRGHQVDILWRTEKSFHFPYQPLAECFELPALQFRKISEQLKKKPYDVVEISQPFAYLVYEKLKAQFPHTLFLNRSHGWEDRVTASRRRHKWNDTASFIKKIFRSISAFLVHQACLRTARACHGIVVPGRKCGDFIISSYAIPADKVRVIPYGTYRLHLKRALPVSLSIQTPDLKILFVGTYMPIKGSEVMEKILPELALKFPKVCMTFVVPAELTEKVRNYYAGYFGPRLTVHPWMERRRLLEIYETHDILLFPSLFEAFGNVFLEAMNWGMCVVGFDEGGIEDIAENGKDALFCKAGDVNEFKKLLEQALQNPERVSLIGQQAVKKVRNHTWVRHTEQMELFCLQLRQKFKMASAFNAHG